MKRRLSMAALFLLAALLLLPRPYSGRQTSAGDLPPLVTAPAAPRPMAEEPLDLNAATLEQLQALPGIGPVRAQRILDYRAQNGPFQSVEELAAVDGIGYGLLEQVREQVTVEKREILCNESPLIPIN